LLNEGEVALAAELPPGVFDDVDESIAAVNAQAQDGYGRIRGVRERRKHGKISIEQALDLRARLFVLVQGRMRHVATGQETMTS